jgi:hypothetical protein
MSNPIYFDTETCGLCGPICLIQYAIGEGEVILYEPWKESFVDTLALIDKFCHHPDGVIGFNLVFDWFQIAKLYTMFELFVNKFPDKAYEIPEDYIDVLGVLEKEARDGRCVKPVSACDVMLVARKTTYQSMMNRKNIIIKKIPNALAFPLSQKLETLIPLNDIYFARRKDKHLPKWQLEEIKDQPDFKNIILRFKPSSALKALASDALGVKEAVFFGEISLPKKAFPVELEYAPFALAVSPDYIKTKKWLGAWPEKIQRHINHWHISSQARLYASNDVVYTRALYHYFKDPELGDDDSELTCLVGAARWRGYAIDSERIKKLKQEAILKKKAAPKAPRQVREYLNEVLSPTERLIIRDTTKKVILEEIASWESEECECIENNKGTLFDNTNCTKCKGTGLLPNQAAIRSQAVLDARGAAKEIEIYDKLLLANRFHASFNVIGALSGRMSGSGGGINPQGINKQKKVRSCFPLAFPGDVLIGGDFVSFEVVLADAAYNDPDLRKQLLSGKSIHGLFGALVYPGMSYEDIMKTKGTSDDKYTRAKSGLFAVLYGGTSYTLKTRLGIEEKAAEEGYQRFTNTYRTVGSERTKIANKFQSMSQLNGIGSRVQWRDPEEYVVSLFGFKRFFTLENKICKALFDLAENPPKEWTKLKITVVRRDRDQTVSGAVRSALFACAFAIQAQNIRIAINHVIQSSGATLTKKLQRRIWDLQPPGINEWLIQPCNIHDEVLTPSKPKMVPVVRKVVDDFVEEHKKVVPLLEMEWKNFMNNWSEK